MLFSSGCCSLALCDQFNKCFGRVLAVFVTLMNLSNYQSSEIPDLLSKVLLLFQMEV